MEYSAIKRNEILVHVDKPQDQTKWKNPDTKATDWWSYLYEIARIGKSIET